MFESSRTHHWRIGVEVSTPPSQGGDDGALPSSATIQCPVSSAGLERRTTDAEVVCSNRTRGAYHMPQYPVKEAEKPVKLLSYDSPGAVPGCGTTNFHELIIKLLCQFIFDRQAPLAQLDRAVDFGSTSRCAFESHMAPQQSDIQTG